MADRQLGIENIEQAEILEQTNNPDFSLARLGEKIKGRWQVMTFATWLSTASAAAIAENQKTEALIDPEAVVLVDQAGAIKSPDELALKGDQREGQLIEDPEQRTEALKPMDYQWGYEVVGFVGTPPDSKELPARVTVTPREIKRSVFVEKDLEILVSPLTEEEFHRSLVHIENGTMNSTYIHDLLKQHELPGLDYAVGGPNAVAGEYDANTPMALQRLVPEGKVPELAAEAELERLEQIRMEEFLRVYGEKNGLVGDPGDWPDEAFDLALDEMQEAAINEDSHVIADADLSIAWNNKKQEALRAQKMAYREQQAQAKARGDAAEQQSMKMMEELFTQAKREHGIN